MDPIALTTTYTMWFYIFGCALFIALLFAFVSFIGNHSLRTEMILIAIAGVILIAAVISMLIINTTFDTRTDDSTAHSTGIVISADYNTSTQQYDVLMWDEDNTELNLIYDGKEFSYTPGDRVAFTTHIDYANDQHLTDTRTLTQIQLRRGGS